MMTINPEPITGTIYRGDVFHDPAYLVGSLFEDAEWYDCRQSHCEGLPPDEGRSITSVPFGEKRIPVGRLRAE
jgi:hypothetical protein